MNHFISNPQIKLKIIKLAFVLSSFIVPKFVINSIELDRDQTLKKINKNTANG